MKHKLDYLFKYRYIFAILLFVFCVFLEISGSSIGMWKKYLNLETDDGVLIGESRAIRSDEWAITTPMIFSQRYNFFQYFNNIIRADYTDGLLIYGLPVFDVLQIFRVFQIGFLLFRYFKGVIIFLVW